MEMTKGIGADAVLECVGTPQSMMQAIHSTRAGGSIGYVGVPHGVELKGEELFFEHVHLHGGPAPVRAFLPTLIGLVLEQKIAELEKSAEKNKRGSGQQLLVSLAGILGAVAMSFLGFPLA